MLTQPEQKSELVQVNCPVCGSSRSKFLFPCKDYSLRVSEIEFGVRRCLDCSCGYVSPRPAEQAIGRYYPDEFYWSYENAEGPISWDAIVIRRQTQLGAKVRWLEGLPAGRLLDIGAQKGEFLWMMRQRGWHAEGVELDATVPNPGGMPIQYGDFLSMEFKPSSFDCITMWAVLEHVYHPARFVQRASHLLKPGGRFIALVTNLDSVQGRFFRADDYPRHLTLFTKKSVRRLCDNQGLALERLETSQEIFGGSLYGGLVYSFKRLFGYSVDEVMSEWKSLSEPEHFCCRWRGSPNWALRNLSRADRLISLPVEAVLDRLGYGFIMTFSAVKAA